MGHRQKRIDAGIGARIAQIRRERGYSQQQLAAACGCSRATICRTEQGTLPVPAERLRTIAGVLAVDDAVLSDDGGGDRWLSLGSVLRALLGAPDGRDADRAS